MPDESRHPLKGPSPDTLHPISDMKEAFFLKNAIDNPNIIIGDYTYCHDPEGPEGTEQRHVFYHFPFIGDKLTIGKFCSLAAGVKFIMNASNHNMQGISTYPFQMFNHGWETFAVELNGTPIPLPVDLPLKGDTMVGHDVWMGCNATILPGIQIGNGAIIGANAMVTRDVPPYAIVAGNPARVIRARFDEQDIATLEAIAWWDWPIDVINRHLKAIIYGDVATLRACADQQVAN